MDGSGSEGEEEASEEAGVRGSGSEGALEVWLLEMAATDGADRWRGRGLQGGVASQRLGDGRRD